MELPDFQVNPVNIPNILILDIPKLKYTQVHIHLMPLGILPL